MIQPPISHCFSKSHNNNNHLLENINIHQDSAENCCDKGIERQRRKKPVLLYGYIGRRLIFSYITYV